MHPNFKPNQQTNKNWQMKTSRLHLNENKPIDENDASDSPRFTHELNGGRDEQVINSVINNDDVTNELNCFLDRRAIKIDNEQTDNMNNNNFNINISNQHTSNQVEKQSKYLKMCN